MAPAWKDARYESLGAEVQKLYDAYVDAYERSQELAQKLQTAATREWLAAHPTGLNGKFISFNVNNGQMRWVWVKKKPRGNYKTVGEDVPSASRSKGSNGEGGQDPGNKAGDESFAPSTNDPRSVIVHVRDPDHPEFKNYVAHVEKTLKPNVFSMAVVIGEDDEVARRISKVPDPKRLYTLDEAKNPYSSLKPGETGLIRKRFRRVGKGDQWQLIPEPPSSPAMTLQHPDRKELD